MLDAILCKITMNNGLLCVQAVGQPAKILMDTSWSIIRADAVQPILSFGQHIIFFSKTHLVEPCVIDCDNPFKH